MIGKQLVLDAIKNKKTPRTPWVPFVGCHAAKLLDVPAGDYFMDADLIVNGALKADELYRPDGLPVLFDLQIEAEALGCGIKFSENNPPAVATHPLEEGKTLADLKVPDGSEGRLPMAMDASRRIVEQLGDKLAIYGLITGPYTLALHLMCTNIFYAMVDEPEVVKELMDFCTKVCVATAKMYADTGVDIIAVVDPMTSQISPAMFKEFVNPSCTETFKAIGEMGCASSFFVCGDATRNIEEMCKCGPDNVSIDENIPLGYVKETASKYGISIGGNIQLTVTMLLGSPLDNIKDAANCAAIGQNEGFILSPGCDMPFGVPEINVQAVAAYVHGEETEFLSNVTSKEFELPEWDKPDYANLDKIVIDAITLDSESCAPCQYTMEAIIAAADGDPRIEYHEHKIKDPIGIACMIGLGAKNIPTICIDGEIKYVSIIPKVETLKADFLATLAKKGL